MAKITETRLERGDPRLQGILIGSVPPYVLEKIRAQPEKDTAEAPDAEKPSDSAIPVEPASLPRT